MKYGILLDGQLIYAQPYYFCSDGRMIVNFNKSVPLMTAYGFKPVFDNIPDYDEKTQYIVFSHYEETEEMIMIQYEILIIELTAEELKEQEKEKCLKLFAETLDDEQALEIPLMFDEWQVGKGYTEGKRLIYNGVLYRVITSHTSQETWTPDNAPTLFSKVINETLDGSVPEWQQPDAINAYMTGDRVMFDGHMYESLIDKNVWSPSAYPLGWKMIEEETGEEEVTPDEGTTEETIPDWVQPGSTNPYNQGDKVRFEGKVYVSLINGNVWSPSAYPQAWMETE